MPLNLSDVCFLILEIPATLLPLTYQLAYNSLADIGYGYEDQT